MNLKRLLNHNRKAVFNPPFLFVFTIFREKKLLDHWFLVQFSNIHWKDGSWFESHSIFFYPHWKCDFTILVFSNDFLPLIYSRFKIALSRSLYRWIDCLMIDTVQHCQCNLTLVLSGKAVSTNIYVFEETRAPNWKHRRSNVWLMWQIDRKWQSPSPISCTLSLYQFGWVFSPSSDCFMLKNLLRSLGTFLFHQSNMEYALVQVWEGTLNGP